MDFLDELIAGFPDVFTDILDWDEEHGLLGNHLLSVFQALVTGKSKPRGHMT